MDINMWKALLWNLLTMLTAAPIVAMCAGWIISLYFKVKEEHMLKTIKTFSEAATKALEAATKFKDIQEKMK